MENGRIAKIMYSRKLKVSKVCTWTIYGSSSYIRILHIVDAINITCTVESHAEPLSPIITTILANSIPKTYLPNYVSMDLLELT